MGFLYCSPDADRSSKDSVPISDQFDSYLKFNGINKATLGEIMRLYKLRFGDTESETNKGLRDVVDQIHYVFT